MHYSIFLFLLVISCSSPLTPYSSPLTPYSLPLTPYPLLLTHYSLPITPYPLLLTIHLLLISLTNGRCGHFLCQAFSPRIILFNCNPRLHLGLNYAGLSDLKTQGEISMSFPSFCPIKKIGCGLRMTRISC